MRNIILGVVVGVLASGIITSQAVRGQTVTTTYIAAADVAALVAKAQRERKPDQPNLVQAMLQLPPYTANLEYRIGANAPASVHEREAELFYVIDGSGTIVTGGQLHDEKRTNPANRSGSRIDSGTPQRLAKGDVVFVPENTPHWFTDIPGTLVLMSLHVPRVSGDSR
jgi:mannose-6-phosphate isomerase-like protein (cupin superfamily)